MEKMCARVRAAVHLRPCNSAQCSSELDRAHSWRLCGRAQTPRCGCHHASLAAAAAAALGSRRDGRMARSAWCVCCPVSRATCIPGDSLGSGGGVRGMGTHVAPLLVCLIACSLYRRVATWQPPRPPLLHPPPRISLPGTILCFSPPPTFAMVSATNSGAR